MIADPTCLSLDLTDKHENSSVTHECKLTKNECVLAAFKSTWSNGMAKTMLVHGMHHDQTHIKRHRYMRQTIQTRITTFYIIYICI